MDCVKDVVKKGSPNPGSAALMKPRLNLGLAAVAEARKEQTRWDRPGPGAGQAALSAFREMERLRRSNLASNHVVSHLKGPGGEIKERFRSRLHRRLFDT